MSEWIIKKGNTAVQDIPIRDEDGELVTNLGLSGVEIKFQIKRQEIGAFLVEKTIGAGIEVDMPDTGYLRLTLTATDTNQAPRLYYMGLQITWDAEVREVILRVGGLETERLKIVQDIVNT